MSERLPYELQLQQQWIDLPLPDENMAWADMRRRLEEDEDRPVIAWWRRGCAGWIIIGLLLIALIWWWLRPEQWFMSEASTNQSTEQTTNPTTNSGTNTNSTTTTNTSTNATTADNTNNLTETTAPHNNAGTDERSITPESNTELTQQQRGNTPSSGNGPSSPVQKTNTSSSGRSNISSSGGGKAGSNPPVSRTSASSNISTSGGGRSNPRRNQRSEPPVKNNTVSQQPITTPTINNTVTSADSSKKSINNTPITQNPIGVVPTPDSTLTDSTAIVKKDSVKKDSIAKPPVAITPKTDSAKKNRIFFSAGVAMHQQIPLAGQKLTPYSASGRKFSLADYIPSVYFRVNKENKWFIQGEFRYGAPQYTKDILFKNQTKRDSAGPQQQAYIINTRQTLKKTFYHQLPVTFNYYVMPNWSLGAGLAWNKFSSAVVDRQRSGFNVVTSQDTTFPDNGIIQVRKDSAFSNSYFQAVFETHYQWKRFSFGARYMFGLSPYLKFDLPGGAQEEKNSSLQLFIRYDLWRSRKK